ncbi:MAG: hypothetical protein QM661_04270 [Solimonas sp.]
MFLFRFLAALLVSGALLHAAEAAQAQSPDEDKQRRTREESRLPPAPAKPSAAPNVLPPNHLRDMSASALTPDNAAREIQRRHGGRVLAVQPDGTGYRVKMLKDGEVRIYQVNP